jgi:hypothetical protein
LATPVDAAGADPILYRRRQILEGFDDDDQSANARVEVGLDAGACRVRC